MLLTTLGCGLWNVVLFRLAVLVVLVLVLILVVLVVDLALVLGGPTEP